MFTNSLPPAKALSNSYWQILYIYFPLLLISHPTLFSFHTTPYLLPVVALSHFHCQDLPYISYHQSNTSLHVLHLLSSCSIPFRIISFISVLNCQHEKKCPCNAEDKKTYFFFYVQCGFSVHSHSFLLTN